MITLETLNKFEPEAIYGKLFEACSLDIGLSVVEWVASTTYIGGELFNFRGFEYLIQPANDMYPRQAIIKPAQKGASEIWARKMFALLYRYSTVPHYYEQNGEERSIQGIAGIYSFPNDADLQKFSKDRIMTKIINPCPTLKNAMKSSESEAITQIGINSSFCYMSGRRSDAGNQSIPAEIIMIDEFDRPLMGDRGILSSLAARTKKARIYGNEYFDGLIINYGTPTAPDEKGVLIDGLYFLSDQFEWFVRCVRCGAWQVVEYPKSIANFYEKGEKKPAKDPYWMCLKCHKPLDFSEIGKWRREEPLKYENAEWVAKYPERTKKGDGIRGYRIPFASLESTAKKLLIARDIEYKTTADFYNFGLGFAHRDAEIGLSEADFTKCRYENVPWGFHDPGCVHVMGIDQGCYITVYRLKPGSQTDMNPRGIWQLVWCEYDKDSEAFSKVVKDDRTNQLKPVEGKISQAIKTWAPEVVVCDHLPNTAAAEAEAELHKQVFWLCDSKGNVGMERLVINDVDKEGNIVHKLLEHRHQQIDQYFSDVRAHRFEYPLRAEGDQFETWRDHHKGVKKVVDEDKSFTYISYGADHYCQSGKLGAEAIEVYTIVKPRTTRVGIVVVMGFQSKRD